MPQFSITPLMDHPSPLLLRPLRNLIPLPSHHHRTTTHRPRHQAVFCCHHYTASLSPNVTHTPSTMAATHSCGPPHSWPLISAHNHTTTTTSIVQPFPSQPNQHRSLQVVAPSKLRIAIATSLPFWIFFFNLLISYYKIRVLANPTFLTHLQGNTIILCFTTSLTHILYLLFLLLYDSLLFSLFSRLCLAFTLSLSLLSFNLNLSLFLISFMDDQVGGGSYLIHWSQPKASPVPLQNKMETLL